MNTESNKPAVNTEINLKKLGWKQKYIIRQIVEKDYYLLKTLDNRDNSITIALTDEWGNQDRDISENELQALLKRNILISADATRCLELTQEKFWVPIWCVQEAMNVACLEPPIDDDLPF